MKYQFLPSLTASIFGLAAIVSASPLMKRGDSCPSGYTLSVYYETVAITSTTTPSPTSRITTSASIENTYVETPTTIYYDVVSTSSVQTSSVVSVPETTKVQIQKHVANIATSISDALQKSSTTTMMAPMESIAISSSTSSSTTATSSSSSSHPSSSSSSSSSSETAGTATYYGGNLSGGTCSFSDYTLPSSLFGTALSIDQWDDAANCGACVAVKGPNGKTIKAMVITPRSETTQDLLLKLTSPTLTDCR